MTYLTRNEEQVLRCIADFTARHGYPPTIRDIMDGTSYRSSSAVSGVRDRLVEKGLVRFDREVSRSLRLTGAGRMAIMELNERMAQA